MKLIVGLGNPGKEYEKTRHNIGFAFIDYIANKKQVSFNEKFDALCADFTSDSGEKIVLVKPQTFMNLSGRAVSKIVQFYKIEADDIFIAFDDLDMTEGNWKIQHSKYPKVHNGVNDIISKLSTDKLNFIRIGIDGRSPELRSLISGKEYVLQRYNFDFEAVFLEIYRTLSDKHIL